MIKTHKVAAVDIVGNKKGGGMMAVGSTIKVKVEASYEILIFDNNHAIRGGGASLHVQSDGAWSQHDLHPGKADTKCR